MLENSGKSVVLYSDFGAVGDGVTNDFFAIYNAHEYANLHKLPVKADEGKTYLITHTKKNGVPLTAAIKTDTDWQGATFIIDDSALEDDIESENTECRGCIFTILPYEEKLEISKEAIATLKNVGTSTTSMKLGLGYPALLEVYNENHRNYHRYGYNSSSEQKEIVLIDSNGNLDPEASFLRDYSEVTKILATRIDIPPLTVKNATFIQIASHINPFFEKSPGVYAKRVGKGFARNIRILRSNTTLDCVNHKIKGEITLKEQLEGQRGPFYNGFYSISGAHNVTVQNSTVSARRYYFAGTYGFSASMSNRITFKNCSQDNFYIRNEDGSESDRLSMSLVPEFNKPYCWGFGGTNLCKNMVYDSCRISRFDAHKGLHNGKIINSHLTMVNLIGGGHFLIENTLIDMRDGGIFNLRRDYGSTWEGTVEIKNCEVRKQDGNQEVVDVCNFAWVNQDFGYTCHVPNIILDGLTLPESVKTVNMVKYNTPPGESEIEPSVHLGTLKNGEENLNPTVPPAYISAKNTDGRPAVLVNVPFFNNTILNGVIKE